MTTNVTVTGTTTTVTDDGATVVVTAASSPAIGVAWGAITGTLSDQADLESSLAGKAPLPVLWLSGGSGGWVTCPDVAAFAVTDLDASVRVALDDFTPSAEQYLFGQWGSSQSAWYISILTDGTLRLAWSTTGSDFVAAFSTAVLSGTDGVSMWIRATLDVNDGGVYKVNFYKASDSVAEPSSWTQIGSTVTGGATTSIFNSTAALGVGGISAGALTSTGEYHRAVLKASIGGASVADWKAQVAATRYRDAYGNVWTVNGTANAWMEA